MTPMTASLFSVSAARGQARAVLEFGMVSRSHVEGQDSVLTGVFGGYLYGNLSLGHVAAARVPAMSVADIDRELFGVSDAPPHRRQPRRAQRAGDVPRAAPGDTSAPAQRSGRRTGTRRPRRHRRMARHLPSTESVDDATLVARVDGVRTWVERMMYQLLHVERDVRRHPQRPRAARRPVRRARLVNVLTAGLGTIESALPANQLWQLGRTVGASSSLTAQFDEGGPDLEQRLRADQAARAFVGAFDAFLAAHGARGPDEWELASPTWGSDPSIALGRDRQAAERSGRARSRRRIAAAGRGPPAAHRRGPGRPRRRPARPVRSLRPGHRLVRRRA